MNVSDLFSQEMEPALNDWIRRFTSPLELFSALPQLYANLQSQHVRGTVEDGAIITGPVHIGEGAVVQGQAIIKGPVIVGTGTVVNGHVEIQGGSFIGSNCVIGHACSIVQSMLMNNTNVGSSSLSGTVWSALEASLAPERSWEPRI